MTIGFGDRHEHRHWKWCFISNGWFGHDDDDDVFAQNSLKKKAEPTSTPPLVCIGDGLFFETATSTSKTERT